MQGPDYLSNTSWMPVTAVIRWNNLFTFTAPKVAACVGHEAVTADFRISFRISEASVADDAVIGDARVNWEFIYGFHESVGRAEGVDACREAFISNTTVRKNGHMAKGIAEIENRLRHADEFACEHANPVRCELGTPVRRANENRTGDVGPRLKDEHILHEFLFLWWDIDLIGRLPEVSFPDFVPAVC